MFADRRDRKLVAILEALLDVVGSKGGIPSDHLDVLLSQHEDIGISSQDNTEITQEARNLTGSLLGITDDYQFTLSVPFHLRYRQAWEKLFADSHRAGTRSSTTVRRRE